MKKMSADILKKVFLVRNPALKLGRAYGARWFEDVKTWLNSQVKITRASLETH
jgi:hypothetical protein